MLFDLTEESITVARFGAHCAANLNACKFYEQKRQLNLLHLPFISIVTELPCHMWICHVSLPPGSASAIVTWMFAED